MGEQMTITVHAEMVQGIYQMTMQEYLALPALSSGVAHTLISASPLHARFEQQNERAANSAMDIGEYAHAMLLEGGHAGLVVIEADDWRTKAAKEQRDAARADGKLPILAHKLAAVEAMVDAAHGYIQESDIAEIFLDGKPEQTIVWQEGDTWCKARFDWLGERYAMHYKTTQASVSPRSFSRLAANSGYDFALMFYLRGLGVVLPDNEANHVILAQEQSSPYACKLFDLTAARAGVSELLVSRAIVQWGRCQAENKWPSYDGTIHSIDVTPWELAQAEEDMLTDSELNGGIPA